MHKNLVNGETFRPNQIKSVKWYISHMKSLTHSLADMCSPKDNQVRKIKRMMLDRMDRSLDLRTVIRLQVDLKILMRRFMTKE